MTNTPDKKPTTLELRVAKVICDAHGECDWKYLKDIEGNPSTAYAYFEYLKMAQAAIKVMTK